MIIKNLIRALKYKLIYPTAKVSLGSSISRNSNLGAKTIIGEKSSIDTSNIGNNSCIYGRDNHISNSSIGNDIQIYSNSNISDSIIGNESRIYSNTNILQSKLENNIAIYTDCNVSKAVIGRFSYITEGAKINLSKMGSFCSIGPKLICGYGEHPTNLISTHPVFFSTKKQCGVSFSDQDYFEESRKISIGHDVWIGARVFIKDGVNIGNGVIVAAGAVVTTNIPDYAIVGGIPAKIIRFRFPPDIIKELLNIKWWEWSEDLLKKAQPYFNTIDYNQFINFCKNN